jgi:hypothetical protein
VKVTTHGKISRAITSSPVYQIVLAGLWKSGERNNKRYWNHADLTGVGRKAGRVNDQNAVVADDCDTTGRYEHLGALSARAADARIVKAKVRKRKKHVSPAAERARNDSPFLMRIAWNIAWFELRIGHTAEELNAARWSE